MLIAALSTGNKIGLGVVAGIFIAFALTASFIAPRRHPDFPGRNGLSVFVIASFVLFAAMITAVEVFGVESEAKGAHAAAAHPGSPAQSTIAVTESEFKIVLQSPKLTPGTYTFDVKNAGKIEHDLVLEGPKVTPQERTPLIKPGAVAKLTVSLATGAYTVYCSVPGHRQAGMSAKISVG